MTPAVYSTYRLLIVDDDAFTSRYLLSLFRGHGFVVEAVESVAAALARLDIDVFDAVLADYSPVGIDGIELCRRMAELRPGTPVVLMTADASFDTAISALRAGSVDIIRKPFSAEEAVVRLTRPIEIQRLRGELQRLKPDLHGAAEPGSLLGECTAITRLRALLGRVRDSQASVLIVGETGTGKEVVARALHVDSSRAAGPLVAVNCSAIPENLFESELFGHARGAFTDAKGDHTGLIVHAAGGTLLLDELGEMPLTTQPKLLRALEERVVRPVGSTRTLPIDVRLIATTNSDLETKIADGRFREDLYFRISVIRIEVPPLRTRGNDILLLARHFLEHFARVANKQITGMHHEVARRLLAYPWPGNVRELRNAIEYGVALAARAMLEPVDLPERIAGYHGSHVVVVADSRDELPSLHEVERRHIQRVLTAAAGNKSVAAKILQLDRTTLYRRIERLGIGSDSITPRPGSS